MNGPSSLGQSVSTTSCSRMFAHFGGHLSLSSRPANQTGPLLSCCLSSQENDSAKSPPQPLLSPCCAPQAQYAHLRKLATALTLLEGHPQPCQLPPAPQIF